MHYSLIQLAQNRGAITLQRDRATDTYDVLHFKHGETITQATIDYVEGEDVRDTKSRAIAAVRMLGYWPAQRRELALEQMKHGITRRGITRHTDLGLTDRSTFERASRSGLILPGAP